MSGAVYNRCGVCVAHVPGHTWTQREWPTFASPMNTYYFELSGCEDSIRVHATTLTNALRAIGYGSSYAAEWGDYAGLIHGLRRRAVRVYRLRPVVADRVL